MAQSNIGAELRRMRDALGWSRREAKAAADGVGLTISEKKIERWEEGENTPKAAEVTRYVEALGGQPSHILAMLTGDGSADFEQRVAYYDRLLRGAGAAGGAPEIDDLMRDLADQLLTVQDSAERARIADQVRGYLAGVLANRRPPGRAG